MMTLVIPVIVNDGETARQTEAVIFVKIEVFQSVVVD